MQYFTLKMDRALVYQVRQIHLKLAYFVCQLQVPPSLIVNLIASLIDQNANLTCHHSRLPRIVQEALSQVLHFHLLSAFFPHLQDLSLPTQVSFSILQPPFLLVLQPLSLLILSQVFPPLIQEATLILPQLPLLLS